MRPDAFIPHPYPDLSVSRHTGLNISELWDLGRDVANKRKKTLYGRTDIKVSHCYQNNLRVLKAEPPRNHANINGWPEEKSEQKLVALELAKVATNLVEPNVLD